MPIERTKRLHMLVSEDESAMLRLLAEREGLSVSDYIRTWVRRAYEEHFPGIPVRKAVAQSLKKRDR